ncbi:MAG: hypothetical protein Kow00107_11620 [Planctomycetota bacterium]
MTRRLPRYLAVFLLAVLAATFSFAEESQPAGFASAAPYMVWATDQPWLKVMEADEIFDTRYCIGTTPTADGSPIAAPKGGYWGVRIAGKHDPIKFKAMMEEMIEKKVPGLWIDWHYGDNEEDIFYRMKGLKFLIIECYEPLHAKTFWRLSAMVNLEVLDIRDWVSNKKELPEYDLSRLRDMKSLKRLALTSDRVTDGNLGFVGGLKQLTHLRVHSGKLTNDSFKKIRMMPELMALDLQGRFNVVDPEIVSTNPYLKDLSIRSYTTELEFSQEAFKEFLDVNVVSALHLQGFDDNRAEVIAKENSIVRISIDSSGISNEGFNLLAKLPSLRQLTAKSFKLAGGGVKALGGFAELRTLKLYPRSISVSASDFEPLAETGKLESLSVISPDDDTEDLVEGISKIRTLRKLTLAVPKLDDLAKLSALEKLEVLEVDASKFTSECYSTIAGLPALKTLVLHNCKGTDADIAKLADLKTLENLTIYKAALSETALSVLAKYPSLKSLVLVKSGILPGAGRPEELKKLKSYIVRE